MKNRIFIACDFKNENNLNVFLKTIDSIDKSLYSLKIGLQLFAQRGMKLIEDLASYEIFLDLKLFDIPNTILNTLLVINNYKNVKYVTIALLSNSNYDFIMKKKWNFKILGVTILTSLKDSNLLELGIGENIQDEVLQLSRIALRYNFYGVICSVWESLLIKKKCNDLRTFCPGIRINNQNINDQLRVALPEEAKNKYVDAIIIGRSITHSKKPVKTFMEIYERFIS